MLNICTDILPQTGLSYVAFRAAFQETIERIVLARQIGADTTGCFGYLTEVPFLQAVPPHVQLDLLSETWSKHVVDEPIEANLVDESVVFAACETAARVAEEEPLVFRRYVTGGPVEVESPDEQFMASELRSLHLNLSNDGDFLMISQFEDMLPDEAGSMKEKMGLDPERLEVMFDVLGRWSMSEGFLMNLTGLLTKREIVRSALDLGVK